MTRNEAPGAGLYDSDFYAWTQREAAALRALPPDGPATHLDIANLAEEIADLGRRDLREVVSYLRLVVQHLVKLRGMPASRDAAHWHAEAVNSQRAARRAFSPGMRRLLDVDDIWAGGCQAAARFLADHGAGTPSPACPFTPDDLLGADFDVAAATARIVLGDEGDPSPVESGEGTPRHRRGSEVGPARLQHSKTSCRASPT